MSESESPARPELSPYIQVWAESLAQVLGQIVGSPFPCVAMPEPPADITPPGDTDLWIVCACTGGLRGEMSLRLAASSVVCLAQLFMSEPVSPAAEMTADHREAAVELLRQVGGLAATGLKASRGEVQGEVQLRLDPSPAAPSWAASSTSWLRLGGDPPNVVLVEMHLSAALVAGLRSERIAATPLAEKADGPRSVDSPVVDSRADGSLANDSRSGPSDGKGQFGLLMDVELAVTLRFGSRRLLLREILDLNPGAVVELDRQVKEPVELLLEGRLMARGEIVVVDGNYGLRVTEVSPPA
jgi:flagellar motor switch protein FliN